MILCTALGSVLPRKQHAMQTGTAPDPLRLLRYLHPLRTIMSLHFGVQLLISTNFREWLLSGSAVAAILSTSFAVFRFLADYRVKVRAEGRLVKSAEIENEVKLLKLFTEIMDIAHARGRAELSEKAVELLLSEKARAGEHEIGRVLNNAVVVMPVGLAAQDAAIAAIAMLGTKYEILRPSAVQALQALSTFKPNAQVYLFRIMSKFPENT